MKNLIIPYNPYCNQEVIEDHIHMLNQDTNILKAKVAFGKSSILSNKKLIGD